MMFYIRKVYAKAGGVAEETLNNVKTVSAFQGQKVAIDSYNEHLVECRDNTITSFIWVNLSFGFSMFVNFATYALGFYYASVLLEDEEENWSTGEKYDVGDVVTTFFGFVMGSGMLPLIVTSRKMISDAQASAVKVFQVIDSVEKVQRTSGLDPITDISHPDFKSLGGEVQFDKVSFSYPTRKDAAVLKSLSFCIENGQRVGIVGETGSGKSTIIQLIERFYDPDSGSITFGGVDISRIEPKVLRTKISLVSQEPLLFATSLGDNVRYGNKDASDAEIEIACKKANAWDFIKNLDNGLDSYAGQGGNQLSGGQKQRIAIARALIKRPVLLLLDEATSALDNTNEREVQEAINNLSRDLTQIVIAHRLTTVRDSDKILVLKSGELIEEGEYNDLAEKGGVFSTLLKCQQQHQDSLHPLNSSETSSIKTAKITAATSKISQGPASQKSFDQSLGLTYAKHPLQGFWRLFSLFGAQKPAFFMGIIGSVLLGAGTLAQSVLLGYLIGTMAEKGGESDFTETAYKICLFYLILAIAHLFLPVVKGWGFMHAGEHLTQRLRVNAFKDMLRMPLGWFDYEKNKTGELTTQLEMHSARVRRLSGVLFGNIAQGSVSFFGAIIVAFYFAWQLALVLVVLTPLLLIRGYATSYLFMGFSRRVGGAINEAGSLVSESVKDIRTLHSLNIQDQISTLYESKVRVTDQEQEKLAAKSGIYHALGQFSYNMMYSACFFVGVYLIQGDHITFRDMMICIFCIAFGGQQAGELIGFSPDISEAKTAAGAFFKLADSVSPINPYSEEGIQLDSSKVKGHVQFQDVHFQYPTRPTSVLDELSFNVKPGQTAALVGPSGCGKSTIIQLLLRFYNFESGKIFLDGHDITQVNVDCLRSVISLVAQEPILFNTTIEENIRYGRRDASFEEIREAARRAHALEFIETDHQMNEENAQSKGEEDQAIGFKRVVGLRGDKLSGGQKQRIAIARAIIRNPKVLLLDEATSALDNQSEQIVQTALDDVMGDVTTIVVAHRLSTIEGCDNIIVINDGKMVEEGTHQELLRRGRHYSDLVRALK